MKWLGGLKILLLMTCRDAAPLIAQGMDQELGTPDRVAVGAHLVICRSCRRYRKQLNLLRQVLSLIGSRELRVGLEQLSPQARARIGSGLESCN